MLLAGDSRPMPFLPAPSWPQADPQGAGLTAQGWCGPYLQVRLMVDGA